MSIDREGKVVNRDEFSSSSFLNHLVVSGPDQGRRKKKVNCTKLNLSEAGHCYSLASFLAAKQLAPDFISKIVFKALLLKVSNWEWG